MNNMLRISVVIFVLCFVGSNLQIQAKNIKHIHLSEPNKLESILGDFGNDVDSLLLTGHIGYSDLENVGKLAIEGNLRGFDFQNTDFNYGEFPPFSMELVFGTEKCVLEHITLSDNIHELSESAFCNSELKTIKLPNDLEKLNEKAFCNCSRLTEINLNDKIKEIPDMCFYSCSRLNSINLPTLLERIGAHAFSHTRIKRFDIPDSCKEIGSYALSGIIGMEYLKFPEELETIDEGVCFFCPGIMGKNIVLPKKLKEIGNKAFFEMTGLCEISLPEGLEVIRDQAFQRCDLKELKLPSTLKEIGMACFTLVKGDIYCYSPIPPVFLHKGVEELFFCEWNECDSHLKTLYVPYGCAEKYRNNTDWNVFAQIVEMEPASSFETTIETVLYDFFDISGRRVENPTEGNIYIRGGKKVLF